ncbi:MAG: hypothetical protein KDD33_06465 [Bdellovibrionales bacterium]|nr:hypothetical protein [Bdellovibrionales bacterium]
MNSPWLVKPYTLLSWIRWFFFGLMFLVTLFVHRWLGFLLLVALFIWEVLSRYMAPQILLKRYAGLRLKAHPLQKIMDDFSKNEKPFRAQLLELATDWPLSLAIPGSRHQWLISPLLVKKLNSEEQQMLLDWHRRLTLAQAHQLGLQIALLVFPISLLTYGLDRLRGVKKGKRSLQRAFHSAISPLFFPLNREFAQIKEEMEKTYGEILVRRLRDKIQQLLKAHDQWPPAPLAYLTIDPDLILKRKSQYYFMTRPGETAPQI